MMQVPKINHAENIIIRLLANIGVKMLRTYFTMANNPVINKFVKYTFPKFTVNPSFSAIRVESMAIQTYFKELMKELMNRGILIAPQSSEAIYTVRFMVLFTKSLSSLLTRLGLMEEREDIIGLKHEEWFREKGIKYLNDFVFYGKLPDSIDFMGKEIRRDDDNWEIFRDYIRTLAHEYVHWLITRGTSIALLINAFSWVVRLDWMYLTDRFHDYTGYPRKVKDVLGMNIDEEIIRKKIKDLVSKEDVQLVFDDLTKHYLFIFGPLAQAVTLIVEPVTWPIIDCSDYRVDCSKCSDVVKSENYENELAKYFTVKELHDAASNILNMVIDRMKQKDFEYDSIIDIINIAKKTINIPTKTLVEIVNSPNPREIINIIHERFNRLMDGKEVEVASPEEIRSINVYYYILNVAQSSRYVSSMLTRTIKWDSLMYLIKRVGEELGLKGKGVPGDIPQILALYMKCDDKGCRVPNLPYVGYLRERVFGTLEDLISDYPLTMKITLDILINKSLYNRNGDDYLEILRSCFASINECSKLWDDMNLEIGHCDKECSGEILGLTQAQLKDRVAKFMELWFDIISRHAECLMKLPAFQGIFMISEKCEDKQELVGMPKLKLNECS